MRRLLSELLPHEHLDRGAEGAQAERDHPLRRAGLGLRGRRSRAAHRTARAGHPGARHLLRHAGDGAESRRRVEQAPVGEFGRSNLHVREHGTLLRDLPDEQQCWMSHRDTVYEAPPGFIALASSDESPVAAFEDAERQALRDPVPPRGRAHALRHRCAQALPLRRLRRRRALERRFGDRRADRPIRAQVGDGKVICGLSGGVDSSVAALLVHKADRRPADLRVRRPRHDAQERGRAGRRPSFATTSTCR